MVWWVDRMDNIPGLRRIYDKYDIKEDRLFQTVNIMFNFTEEISEPYDIHSLLKSGVNIFNIDRTVIDDPSYKVIKKAIYDCKKLPQMCQTSYLRPVCLCVTMSTLHPILVDKEIDVVILKDAHKEKKVREFKEFSLDHPVPVYLWFSRVYNDNLIDLISNGIVLDYSTLTKKYCNEVMKLCRQYRRPVFCVKPEVSEDMNESHGGKRKLFVIASEILNNGFDGIVVNGTEETIAKQKRLVHSIVEALRAAEDQHDAAIEFDNFKKQILIPQLAPMTVAIAASSVAVTSGASAIIVITTTGNSARLMACASPPCHIIAISRHEWAVNQMHLYKKVLPLLYKEARAESWQEECRKRVLFGTQFAMKTGLLDGEAKLVVLAPSEEGIAHCDAVQIVAAPFICDE